MTRIVKTLEPEPELYVVFEGDKIILVRTNDIVVITFSQWDLAERAVKKHRKALARARQGISEARRKTLAAGYKDWLRKHFDVTESSLVTGDSGNGVRACSPAPGA